MFRLDADRAVEFCDGLRRRDFLHAGSPSLMGLGLPQLMGLKAQGAVDRTVSKFETSQDARLLDSTFHQAYTLMSSHAAPEAFEPFRSDSGYGKHPIAFGEQERWL